ncbi:MAG TPA: response regulator [Bacillota bacterium]
MESRFILMVEDNSSDVKLAQRAFEKKHVVNELVVVRDGQEALDFLFGTGSYHGRNISDLPAFILLDLKLPKLDGLAVLERVKSDQRTRLIPVIILTTSNENSDLKSAYLLGANSYIRKPVDYNNFVEVVSQLGTYWLGINEAPPVIR